MSNNNKENIITYYKHNVLTKIDISLYQINYNCFACYYRKFLLKINSNQCLFGDHLVKKNKWFSCHLLPLYNPNGDLLKLYNIVNQNIPLFLHIYYNTDRNNFLFNDLNDFNKNKKLRIENL